MKTKGRAYDKNNKTNVQNKKARLTYNPLVRRAIRISFHPCNSFQLTLTSLPLG